MRCIKAFHEKFKVKSCLRIIQREGRSFLLYCYWTNFHARTVMLLHTCVTVRKVSPRGKTVSSWKLQTIFTSAAVLVISSSSSRNSFSHQHSERVNKRKHFSFISFAEGRFSRFPIYSQQCFDETWCKRHTSHAHSLAAAFLSNLCCSPLSFPSDESKRRRIELSWW